MFFDVIFCNVQFLIRTESSDSTNSGIHHYNSVLILNSDTKGFYKSKINEQMKDSSSYSHCFS